MKEMINTYIRQYRMAINLTIRTILNLVVLSVYPTYLILIYFGVNGIFPYDIFTQGKFGIDVFFYMSSLLIIMLIIALASPFYFLWEGTIGWQKSAYNFTQKDFNSDKDVEEACKEIAIITQNRFTPAALRDINKLVADESFLHSRVLKEGNKFYNLCCKKQLSVNKKNRAFLNLKLNKYLRSKRSKGKKVYVMCHLVGGLLMLSLIGMLFYGIGMDKALEILPMLLPPILIVALIRWSAKLSIKDYLKLCIICYGIILVFPIVAHENAAKFVSIGLSNFNIGGNSLKAVIKFKDGNTYEGTLLFLSPTMVYIKPSDNSSNVIMGLSEIQSLKVSK